MERAELHPATDERAALRARAIQAIGGGESKQLVARRFGVTRQTLYNWLAKHRRGGTEALAARPRRPRRGLAPWQQALVAEAIRTVPPWIVGPRYTRWTRRAVAVFIENHFGLRLSDWQVDRHLRGCGFASQKEVRRAFMGAIPQGAPGWPLPE